MAWPPPVLPTNRTDAAPQGPGTHSNDHNAANLAINDLVAMVGQLNNMLVVGARGAVVTDAFGDFTLALPAGMATVTAALCWNFYDANLVVLHRVNNLTFDRNSPCVSCQANRSRRRGGQATA